MQNFVVDWSLIAAARIGARPNRVRMREEIAQLEPDFAIVRVLRE